MPFRRDTAKQAALEGFREGFEALEERFANQRSNRNLVTKLPQNERAGNAFFWRSSTYLKLIFDELNLTVQIKFRHCDARQTGFEKL